MANLEAARRLALQAARDKKLVRCQVESAEEQAGGVRVVISGSLDVNIDMAIDEGHDRDAVSDLVSNMRLQVDVEDGRIIKQEWLR